MSADRVVRYVLKGDVAGFSASMKAAGASVGKLGDDLTKMDASGAKMRAGLSTVGDAAGKMGLAAAAGVGLVVKAAMDWESAWAGVQKTVNGSASEMAVLEGELRNLARTLPATHTEIAAVAEAAGQLGIERESVAAFTRTMIDLGETTNLSADEAATSIARFTNIMGTSAEEVSNIGSAIVELGNNSATTEAEIMVFGTRLAAAGAIAGLTEGEVLGFGAALSSVGVEAEAGGTALSKVFTSMRDAAIDGGDKLEVFARTAGMTAQEFTAAWSEDPAQVINSFVMGLGDINDAGQSTSAVFKELGLTDQRLMKALLSAAEAGELLGDSLDMGNTGFADNTALAIEAAKRYETTASQVQVSWNNVKDAAIGFGEAALPVLEAGADKMASFAQAIGSIPQPVKSATTSLLGITAILGGSLWFGAKAVSGIASMRGALDALHITGEKASKTMKGLGAAVAILAVTDALDSFITRVKDAPPGLEAMTRALIDFENAAAGSTSRMELDAMAESIDRLLNPEWNQTTDDWLRDKLPLFGDSAELKEATADIAALDTALAHLVSTGNEEIAADWLASLDPAKVEALSGHLTQYDEALLGVENSSDLATDGTEAFTAATGEIGSVASDAAAELGDLIDAMREQRSEALRAANAEINYEAALDDSRKALKENGRTVDISTEKGRANMKALYGQAAAFNDLSAEAKNAPGAHRAAIASFVNMAKQMGMGEAQARRLAQSIIEIPDKKVTITADTAPATAALDSFIRSQSGRVISIGTRIVASSAGIPGGMVARAEGGPVYGEGTATSDSIPAWLSNGEFVMKAAAVQKYGLRAMHDLNAMRLAGGGPVGMAGGGSVDDRLSILRLQQQINEMRRDLAKDGKDSLKGLARTIAALELKAAQADLRQARRAPLAESRAGLREARQGLRSIEFDVEGGMSLADTREALRQFRTDVREAGGTWTRQMANTARRLIDVAKASQRNQNQLERETEKRDRLGEVLEQEIAALEQLQQTMAAYSASVAGKFLNDPFNGARAVTGGSAAPVDDAALNAARAALSGAESRLSGIRGSDMDPLQRSYLASKAVAEVAEYRSQVEQLDRGREALGAVGDESEQMVSGLEALRETLVADTKAAQEFAASLATLSAAGLSAGLFQQLAASGDTGTAAELAGLGAGGIAELNAMWDQREAAAAQVATFATQQVFGAQLDAATRAVEAAEKAFQQSDREIARLNRITERHATRIENLTERGTDAIVTQVRGVQQAIQGQARQLQELQRAGKKGRN